MPPKHVACIDELVDPNREETAADAMDEEQLNAELGFDEEFDTALEEAAREAGGAARRGGERKCGRRLTAAAISLSLVQ